MKTRLCSLFFCGLLSLSIASAQFERWKIEGTLNYVNPLLATQFAVGDTWTVVIDLDPAVGTQPLDRRFDYSTGNIPSEAFLGGKLTIGDYTAVYVAPSWTGSSIGSLRHSPSGADATSSNNYDQLSLGWFSFEDAVIAPAVGEYEVSSSNLNFTDEEAPFDMLVGSEAAFPELDVPFPGAETFNPASITNGQSVFDLRFSGGEPQGTNFIRGELVSITIGEGDGPLLGKWDTATPFANGWRQLEWFNFFWPSPADENWIYHAQLGWLYTQGEAEAFHAFSADFGWVYIQAATFPVIYRADTDGWYFYQTWSESPRWFYAYATEEWVNF